MGMLNPFMVRVKVAMRELVKEVKGWDSLIGVGEFQRWMELFLGMFELEKLKFARCVKPVLAEGLPELIIFADASTIAFGAVAYLRWQ